MAIGLSLRVWGLIPPGGDARQGDVPPAPPLTPLIKTPINAIKMCLEGIYQAKYVYFLENIDFNDQ